MPRYARRKSEKQVYHVMLRGNNRQNIFIDEEDKTRIINTLEDKKKDDEYFLYAYCVMDNHMHMVIKEGKDQVARIEKARIDFARFNHEFTDDAFVDVCEEKEIVQSSVQEYIDQYLARRGLRIDDLKGTTNKPVREELIKLLLEKTNLSLRGIAVELRLSREMVRRAVSRDLSP